jgi:tRNA(His) 5'-end guanylyltransferase
LRKEGKSVQAATAELHARPVSFKNELLFLRGINFNELPLWQRRGTGLYWERYEKEGYDPVRQQTVKAPRRRVKVDGELPVKQEYDALIVRLLGSANTSEPRS